MTTKPQTTVVVTTEFRGFGTPPIVETITTTSTPSSPRWSATLQRICQSAAKRHAGPHAFVSDVRSVSAALQAGATIQ
jgi:hypothetical protein